MSLSASYCVTAASLQVKMTGFPESFQRSTVTPSPSQYQEVQSHSDADAAAAAIRSDASSSSSSSVRTDINSGVNSLSFRNNSSFSPSRSCNAASAASSAAGRAPATVPSSAPGSGSSIEIGRGREYSPVPSPRRVSRSNVMRLENILNDVSMNHDHRVLPPTRWPPRSRSLGSGRSESESPVQSQSHLDIFAPSSPSSTMSVPERSESPEEEESGPVSETKAMMIKKKKVKMHRCPECQKDFPRPSGLRTHMNMHTKEKPFACTYPGCTRSFSVVSNARRHMRTHGLGVSVDDGDQAAIPYVVGFEDPMVLDQPDVLSMQGVGSPSRSHPFRLRWIPLGASMQQKVVADAAAKSVKVGGGDGNGAVSAQG